MRKRSVVLGACIFAAFSLTGCKDTETPKGNPTFNATVLEIGENRFQSNLLKMKRYQQVKLRLQRMLYQRLKYRNLKREQRYVSYIMEKFWRLIRLGLKPFFAIYLLDENGEAIIPKDSD